MNYHLTRKHYLDLMVGKKGGDTYGDTVIMYGDTLNWGYWIHCDTGTLTFMHLCHGPCFRKDLNRNKNTINSYNIQEKDRIFIYYNIG